VPYLVHETARPINIIRQTGVSSLGTNGWLKRQVSSPPKNNRVAVNMSEALITSLDIMAARASVTPAEFIRSLVLKAARRTLPEFSKKEIAA
jgi:hypothetical protein